MIERENTPMTTSSDVIAGLELALASADAMIERLPASSRPRTTSLRNCGS